MARILVTGGTGFIGANLVKKLCSQGHNVTIFANVASHPFLKGLKIRIIKGDIRNYSEVLKAVKGQEYVYHLAATAKNLSSEKGFIFGTNITGTKNVAKACLAAGVKKMVYASSSATLGFSRREKPLDEKNCMDFKDNLYGQSKKYGEDEVQKYIKKGLNASIFIPSYVIGAGEIDPVRFGLWKSINNERIKFTYPGGSSLVAVEDLIEGIILVMRKGGLGKRYILSSEYLRLFDFYNMIARAMGTSPIRWRVPHWTWRLAYGCAAVAELMLQNPPITREGVRWHFNYKKLNSTKTRKELGWTPKVPIEESIKRVIGYYIEIGVFRHDYAKNN